MDEDGIFYSLPYIDPQIGQSVITPHWDARTGQPIGDFWTNIVPVEEETSAPSRQPTPSYETPWWVDTINRGIERAAQVATIEAGGYPPYPEYPTPSPTPYPGPFPQPHGGGVTLSTTTLMLLVGGFLLFSLGQRRGR